MLHHEKSPEKPQYNMATSAFLDKPPISRNPPKKGDSSTNFQIPPFPSILKNLNPHPHRCFVNEGGRGLELCYPEKKGKKKHILILDEIDELPVSLLDLPYLIFKS